MKLTTTTHLTLDRVMPRLGGPTDFELIELQTTSRGLIIQVHRPTGRRPAYETSTADAA
jgi:hypothetical protein